MEIEVGSIVRSKAGHDSGRFYLVIGVEKNFAYVVDGRNRKLSFPKKKNVIHLSRTARIVNLQEYITDKAVRALLHSYNYSNHYSSH